MIFYTYLWLRESGVPYYVGKGSGNRAYWRPKTAALKPPPVERVLVQEFPDEQSAFAAEKFLISFYGRKDLGLGHLINHAEGGLGTAGARWSETSKKKLAESMRGNRYCVGKTPWNKGRKMPKSTRRSPTPETREKIRNTLKIKGIKPPDQTGYRHSEETKKKIGSASKLRLKMEE